jgi:hypothetical protein
MIRSALRLLKRPFTGRWGNYVNVLRDGFTINPVFSFSKYKRSWDTHHTAGVGGWVKVSNLSGGYHGLLRQWWEHYGLGKRVLLISETSAVRKEFEALYRNTEFVATDYFTEIAAHQSQPDVVWNLYDAPPAKLKEARFNSIICQATMEHVHDPVGVLRRLVALLEPVGFVYIHTHTPGFQYHSFPRDYLRFYPDWFEDIPLTVAGVEVVEIYCADGYAFCVLRKV